MLVAGEGRATGPAPTVAGAVVLPEAAPTAGPAGGACEVAGPDDVGRIVGNPVRAGTGDAKFCFWGTRVDRGTSATVTVERHPQDRAAAVCETHRASQPREATHEPVNGVGSSAVWVWQPVAILIQGNLVSCWRDAVIVVGLTGERDQAVMRDQAVSLARAVHDRL